MPKIGETKYGREIGKYHYDYQTADCERGKYTVIYKATDGSRITIEKETFEIN